MRAAKEFNLTLIPFDDDDAEAGIWDGDRFLIKVYYILIPGQLSALLTNKLTSSWVAPTGSQIGETGYKSSGDMDTEHPAVQ